MLIIKEGERKEKTAPMLEADGGKTPVDADIGFAVDIGTTTVAMEALDLRGKPKRLGGISAENSQKNFGTDVLMRIMHCHRGKKEQLHALIVQQMEQMAQTLSLDYMREKNISAARSYFFVVGNTTMCHLFLNRSVEGLAGYPFTPDYKGNYRCEGKDVGFTYFAKAKICVLSGIAAHVGADALAVIGAEKIYDRNRVQLAVDLGTNAEVILNYRGHIRVCSAAAGPAFEGKEVSCGMSAKPGAIEQVTISPGNGNIVLRVIEQKTADGICASGYVDLLSRLKKLGALRGDGCLLNAREAACHGLHPSLCERLQVRNGERVFLLCKRKENGREIYLSQNDVRSLQLAKAAIEAGAKALLDRAGLSLSDLDDFMAAGVLGNRLSEKSAKTIGLFPTGKANILFAGNAATKGAVTGLLDDCFADQMERLAQTVLHEELAENSDFQKNFLSCVYLREWV